jgi:hypothetical protein
MGQYCYTCIDITYYDNATDEEIKAFIEEIEKDDELQTKINDVAYVELSSGRVPNLEYQLNKFTDMAREHKFIKGINGSSFVEMDMGIYYDREEEKC